MQNKTKNMSTRMISSTSLSTIQINSFDTFICEMKVMRVRHQHEMKQLIIKFQQQHLNEKENNNNTVSSSIIPNRENKNFRNLNDSSNAVTSSFLPSRTHHSFVVRCKL